MIVIFMYLNEGLTHECGVFGAIGGGEWPTQVDIAQIVCLGLVALQHRYCYILTFNQINKLNSDIYYNSRGQESAGIVTSEGTCNRSFHIHKGMGLISNIFNDDAIRKLKGNLGIGHTRYR